MPDLSVPERAPLISVIIPARNAAATIAQTLDSLLAQTEPRWEALITNDGSTDDTADIIRAYMARDARFAVYQGPGEGLSQSRNASLPHAAGRWLHFLDADDWISPECYSVMLARLADTQDALAAYCGFVRVMPDGSTGWTQIAPQIAENPMACFAEACRTHVGAVLVARSAVQRVGPFDPTLRACEDWDMWQRVARLPGAWVCVPEQLAFYRTNTAGLSRNLAYLEAGMRAIVPRGFGPDARLACLALAHPDGAPGDAARIGRAMANVALWIAVQHRGWAHGDQMDMALFAALSVYGPQTGYQIDVIIEGLMLREAVIAPRLAARWPAIGADMTRLVARFGEIWADHLAARALQRDLEARLLAFDDLAEPRRMQGMWGLRLDMRRPRPVALPPGVELVHAYIMDGSAIRAAVTWPLAGRVSAWRWADLILGEMQTGPGLPRREGALLRLALLLHAVLATLTPGGGLQPEPAHG